MHSMEKNIRPPWGPLLGFGALFVAFFVACALYYLNQYSTIKKGIHQELATIADLKVQQISQWFHEHTNQARILARNIPVADSLRVQPAEAGAAWGEAGILSLMRAVRELHGYQNVMFFDASGVLRLSAMPGQWAPPDAATYKRALSAGLPVISDLVLDARNEIYLDIIVPLPPETATGSMRQGLLVSRSSPQDFLYPLLQSWPTPSPSAETLLVRREGNEILYLNNLRHRGNTAMRLRTPLQEKSLPGDLFFKDGTGVPEGIDYRGIPVLWAAREVPGTPWLLVAKVDTNEILEPLRKQALAAGLVLALLTLGTVLFAFRLWNLRRSPDLSTTALEKEVAERSRTEAELRQSESRFKGLVANLPGVVYRIACAPDRPALDWTIEYMSAHAEKVAGRPAAQFIGTTLGQYSQFIDPDDVEAFFRSIAEHLATDEPYIIEYRLLHSDGSTRWVMARGQLQKDTWGNPQCLEGIIFDITAQKQTETMRRESEARFKSIAESASDAIIIVDDDSRIIYWNDAATRIFGYSAEEMLGETYGILIVEKSQEEIDRSAALYKTAGVTPFEGRLFEAPARRKDGTIIQIAMSGANWSVGGGRYYSVIARDMTQQKKAEEALRESEERFKSIAECAHDAIVISDEDMRLIYWNDAATRIFGYSAEEMLGKTHEILIFDKGHDEIEAYVASYRTTGVTPFESQLFETAARKKDGTIVQVAMSGASWSVGDKTYYSVIARDMTQHKKADEALRESEERFRAFAETCPDAVVMADESQNILYWNASAERIFGYTRQEMLARQPNCLMPPASMQLMAVAIKELSSEDHSRFMDGFTETVALRKSGEEFPCELALFHWVTSGGPQGVVGVILRDITQRKLAEDALRESEGRFRAFAETSPDAISMADENLNIVYWNAAAEKIFGYSKQEMLGRRPDCLMPASFVQPMNEATKGISEGIPSRFMDGFLETVGLRKSGEEFPCELAVFNWQTSGIPKTMVGVILRDITQRKLAEEALRESEARFRAFAETSPDAVVMADESQNILYWNASAERIFGYTGQEMLGRQPDCLMSPSYMQQMAAAADELYKDGRSRFMDGFKQIRAIRKSGEEFPCELAVFHSLTSGMPRGVVGVILRDITQRKLAEEALRESEARFRAFAEACPDAVVMTDESQAILYWNASAERIFGYTRQEMLGRQPDCLMSTAAMQRRSAAAEKLYIEGSSPFMDGFVQTAALRKNGEEFPCELAVFHWLTSDIPQGVMGAILRDITQRKRAEDALRESQEKLAGIISAVTAFMVMVDENLRIVWANDHALQTFGSDILNKTCHEAYQGLAWPCEHCNVRSCFASGLPFEYEHVITTPDGRQHDVWCTTSIAARHEDGSPKHLVHISYDITERKKLQAEALHASHLASIGELAAGVAHEINNPINGIINCADILKHQFEKTGQDADVPLRIIREGERVAAIVKNLLTFARERKGKIEPQDVRSIYADAFDLFIKQFEKHFIITRHDFPENLPLVLAQHQQIQQVFLNLLSNARYALNKKYPDKDPDKLLEVTARAISIEGQPFVRITFHDHGTGIPAGELEKLCNPFYSTKPAGEGTGLGLSISYNIIKDYGGRLQFETREGHYMRVLVDLPAAE